MPFSESGISGLIVHRRGTDLLIRWESSQPEGTVYQVYLGRSLAWSGTQRFTVLPRPTERSAITVGHVDPGEIWEDRSGDPGFPALPELRASLSWLGGTFQGEGVRSFAVYGEPAPGAGIDDSHPVAVIPAYMGDPIDGAGIGPAGRGGAGRAAGSYHWTSPPLSAGAWEWAVRARDASGTESNAAGEIVTVHAPPRPPEPIGPDRVVITEVDDGTVSLSWQESPDHVAPPPPSQNEIQRITIVVVGSPINDCGITLEYGADSTSLINLDASAATVQTALETIAALTGNVSVTGGPLGVNDVLVEFVGGLANTAITDGLSIGLTADGLDATIISADVTVDQPGGS